MNIHEILSYWLNWVNRAGWDDIFQTHHSLILCWYTIKTLKLWQIGSFFVLFVLKFVFRFSLLLLEPGEIYFEDFSVFHYPYDLPEEEAIKRYNTSFTYYLLTCVYLIIWNTAAAIYCQRIWQAYMYVTQCWFFILV